MNKSDDLASILALVRAGASSRAWKMFVSAGFDRESDAGCLTLGGRLLKDRARTTDDLPERLAMLREAASLYEAAATAGAGTYPLINAASLSLLAGDTAASVRLAKQVLAAIEAHPEEPETPYWRSATRAEALLLLDRTEDARFALAEAVTLAPRAWEDHASTLRQFAQILAEQGQEASWLDCFRPPRSLHFAGHMSFSAEVPRREEFDEQLRGLLEEERIGFAYGALAAGADILVAERLAETGAELHIVLPGGPHAFAAASVAPFGGAWQRRFDALLEVAATVRTISPEGRSPDPKMVDLADEVAMGSALLNALRLQSEAVQLLIVPDSTPDPGTASSACRRWVAHGGRQRIVAAPRENQTRGALPPSPQPSHSALALLAVMGAAPEQLDRLASILTSLPSPALAPFFTGDLVMIGYSTAAGGAEAALAIAGGLTGLPRGIGGHYGMVEPLEDPFGGGMRVGGDPASLATAAAASAPSGIVCVTDDFAAALAAAAAPHISSELLGELDPAPGAAEPIALFALKPRL